ncbi:MAG TPA: PKHD-type hydroxylase, partial [bacterium]|nr:PKHD-type hydroxylase [bacterium]
VRDDAKRILLVELELSVQALHRDHPDHPSLAQLTGIYNNLLRSWVEV